MKLPEKKELLDDIDKIRGIDKSAMLETTEKLPQMISDAASIVRKLSIKKLKDIKVVLIGGMGGSAIGGDVAKNLMREGSAIPCECIRNYSLPAYADSKSLLFLVSYSGNTEEILSLAKETQARNIKNIFIITSGGKLEEFGLQNNFPIVKVPQNLQPRAAVAYLSIPILLILQEIGLLKGINESLDETLRILNTLDDEYSFIKPQRINPVKLLALKLLGKIPFIMAAGDLTDVAAYRWKTQLNENSKATAVTAEFPELNHNELVNLSMLQKGAHNFSLIMLRDEKDHERIKKRMEITKSLVGPQLGGSNDIWAKGQSSLARIFSLIYFGDLLSVYLAILKGVDPTPVEVITKLKKEMAR